MPSPGMPCAMMFLFFSPLWRSLTEGRTYRLCIDADGSRSTLQPGDSLVNVFISPLQAQQILPHFISVCPKSWIQVAGFTVGAELGAEQMQQARKSCPFGNADLNLRLRQPSQVNLPCVSTCAAALASFSGYVETLRDRDKLTTVYLV